MTEEYNFERAEMVSLLFDRFLAGLEVDVKMQERAHNLGIDIEVIEDAAAATFREEEGTE